MLLLITPTYISDTYMNGITVYSVINHIINFTRLLKQSVKYRLIELSILNIIVYTYTYLCTMHDNNNIDFYIIIIIIYIEHIFYNIIVTKYSIVIEPSQSRVRDLFTQCV